MVKGILAVATVAAGLLAGGIYIRMGLFIGLAMALSVVILLYKLPRFVRKLVRSRPFLSDLILSGAATALVGGYMGGGLTLAISAAVCGLALSVALPYLEYDDGESSLRFGRKSGAS